MGGSRSGNFGNTQGSRSFPDRLSDILTAASLIPGLDTFADLAAIPVDLLRGDLESALLDVLEGKMTPSELFKKYTFHDSLLEKTYYSPADKTAILEIDFCYWQQHDYTDIMPETGIIHLRFSGVMEFCFPTYPINSDEIVRVRCDSKNTVVMTVYSDLADEYHVLSLTADSVTMETPE